MAIHCRVSSHFHLEIVRKDFFFLKLLYDNVLFDLMTL